MVEVQRARPALHVLPGRAGVGATLSIASDATRLAVDDGIVAPAMSRRARRKALPSLSTAVAPLVHWTPAEAREGDAFRWAAAMGALCAKGDPFVLLLHGGLRDGADLGAWRPYAAWLNRHRAVWQGVCRGVIVMAPDIVTRVEARNDAQLLFSEGTRVVAVSQETLARQLARVLIAERGASACKSRTEDAVVRGSM